MPFVKLDTGILESTLWIDRAVRDVFITALLMAEPYQATETLPTYEIDSLDVRDFKVPVGWYGFVAAAGQGVIRRALVEYEEGMEALKKLSNPDPESRSPEFGGRRMVRIDGGFIVLNYFKYRDKDHGASERMRLYRLRQKEALRRNSDAALPSVTYADADADAYKKKTNKKKSVAFNSTEAAMGYCHKFDVAGEKNIHLIQESIELQVSKFPSETPQSVAQFFIEQRMEFEKTPGVAFTWTPVSFITSGVFNTPSSWTNGKAKK